MPIDLAPGFKYHYNHKAHNDQLPFVRNYIVGFNYVFVINENESRERGPPVALLFGIWKSESLPK